MQGKRVAVVVSHPAHLLAIVGMLLRWRPHVLLLGRAMAGARVGLDEVVQAGLRVLGLENCTTSLGILESESYRQARAGNFAFHAAIGSRIFDWLLDVRPDVVLGDAYEASSYLRDVGRVLLDDAVRRCRQFGLGIANYEFPLSCRIDRPGVSLSHGSFPFGPAEEFGLRADELSLKQRLITWAARLDPALGRLAAEFPPAEVEFYREVPVGRDYTMPPPGLALHYDEEGRKATNGRLEAISYARHFVPLVQALDLGTPTPRREAGSVVRQPVVSHQ